MNCYQVKIHLEDGYRKNGEYIVWALARNSEEARQAVLDEYSNQYDTFVTVINITEDTSNRYVFETKISH